MTYMVPNRFKHLTLGQPTSKQRLIRATHGLAVKQVLLVKTTKKFLKMHLLQEKVTKLQESFYFYQATANRIDISQLKKNLCALHEW